MICSIKSRKPTASQDGSYSMELLQKELKKSSFLLGVCPYGLLDYLGHTFKLHYADGLYGITSRISSLIIWFSTPPERSYGWSYWYGDIIASVFPYNKGEKCTGIISDMPS